MSMVEIHREIIRIVLDNKYNIEYANIDNQIVITYIK